MTIRRVRLGGITAWPHEPDNPMVPADEVFIDTATGQLKVGNGVDQWADLPDDTSDLPATIDGGQP